MTDPDPRPARAAATDPAEPVTVADIAAFTARLARLRPPALGGDPAEYAALLAHKAALFARIADQHARTDPTHAQEARGIAERAHAAARHAADTHDTTNVKDLTSPSFPGWGISLSNTGEFRRASSAHLMRREATRAGLPMSVPALLAELEGIGETVLLYQGERGRPRARHTITRMTPTQQRLYQLFDLARYAPHR